jgi:hypothetical protein
MTVIHKEDSNKMTEMNILESRVQKLETLVYNSLVLKQETCKHHEVTTDFRVDVNGDEIEYEYCDNCGKEWA